MNWTFVGMLSFLLLDECLDAIARGTACVARVLAGYRRTRARRTPGTRSHPPAVRAERDRKRASDFALLGLRARRRSAMNLYEFATNTVAGGLTDKRSGISSS